MNGYELSKGWFDFAFENPEKINPAHSAIYFFAIEHCNRMGWKTKFGFPSQMAMDAVGIRKHDTYIRYFNDLCEWGFFKIVERSKNQYSANIISLGSAIPKNGEALQKAIRKHGGKQTESTGISIGESVGYIDKPLTLEPNNLKPNNSNEANVSPEKDDNVIWVIAVLNKKAGTSFKANAKATQRLINARIKDGYTGNDFKAVITHKVKQWADDPEMSQYLRPSTLFGTKFEAYLNAAKLAQDDKPREFHRPKDPVH